MIGYLFVFCDGFMLMLFRKGKGLMSYKMFCIFFLNYLLYYWEKVNYVEYIFWEVNWFKIGILFDLSWLRWFLCCLSELLVIIV